MINEKKGFEKIWNKQKNDRTDGISAVKKIDLMLNITCKSFLYSFIYPKCFFLVRIGFFDKLLLSVL